MRELRESAGLLQRHVGAELDIDKAAVSEWERGRSNPSRDKLVRLDDLYQASGEVLRLYEVAPTQSPADFMTESRARFDAASNVLSEMSGAVYETAALVRANREQLVLIAEHLGVAVVPEPSVAE